MICYRLDNNCIMDTLVRICETLECGILDVIELVSDEPSVTEKRKYDKTNICGFGNRDSANRITYTFSYRKK